VSSSSAAVAADNDDDNNAKHHVCHLSMMMLQSMSLQYVAIAVVINIVVCFLFVISHPAATAKAEWE